MQLIILLCTYLYHGCDVHVSDNAEEELFEEWKLRKTGTLNFGEDEVSVIWAVP